MLPDLTGTTIVFDLDGTLVDTAPDLTSATNHALAIAGAAPVSVEELRTSIGRGSKVMDGKSILGILLLAASQGSLLEVAAEGVDEHEAVEALAALVDSGFGEEA